MNQAQSSQDNASRLPASRCLGVGTLFEIMGDALKMRFGPTLAATFKWVFLCSLPLQLMAQYFSWIGQVQDERLHLISAIGGALVSLAASSVMILLVPGVVVAGWGARKTSAPPPTAGPALRQVRLWPHFQKQLGPLAIESMRMLPKGILLTMLLVIPGIYYFLRMSFLPYLVQFSKSYGDGRVDALTYSYKFTEQAKLAVFVLAIITGGIQVAMLSAMGNFSIWTDPAIFSLLFLIGVPVSIAIEVIWTSMFIVLFEGAEDELVFPMA